MQNRFFGVAFKHGFTGPVNHQRNFAFDAVARR
jgi:hypothetical protein